MVQGCGPCTVKQLYQVRPTASYALYGQNLTPCAWFSHFHHIQCIKTAISNIVQSVEHFNFSSLFLKQKLIDIFLIFLNLSVPSLARTTITTPSRGTGWFWHRLVLKFCRFQFLDFPGPFTAKQRLFDDCRPANHVRHGIRHLQVPGQPSYSKE